MSKSKSKCDEIKVILLGESGVGKTNIINISTGHSFNDEETATTYSTYSVKKYSIGEKEYKIYLWDTIGQESLRQLTKLFYQDSKIVIFVYDIANKESFEQLKFWTKDVEEQVGNNITKGVIGNKIDLYYNEQVTTEEGQSFAKSIDAKFLSFSAKSENPTSFNKFMLDLLVDYIEKDKNNADNFDKRKRRITLEKNDLKPHKKKKCCK